MTNQPRASVEPSDALAEAELHAWRRAHPNTRYCAAHGGLITETVIHAVSATDAAEKVSALDSWERFCKRMEIEQPPEPPADRYGRREPPYGYAYRYHGYGVDVLRFNNGQEVNGSKPFETVPYWIGTAVTQPAQRFGCAMKGCANTVEIMGRVCASHETSAYLNKEE